MTTFEVVAAKKEKLTDEEAVRAAMAKLRPEAKIIKIADKGKNGWLIQLEKEADVPPFLKKKDDDADADSDASDLADDDSSDDDDDLDSDSDSDKGDKKDKGADDLVGELRDLVDQAQKVLKDVVDKAEGVNQKAEEHKDKLDKAQDVLGDEGKDDGPPMPADLGPVPGGPPPAPPGGASPIPRRPGIPTGRRPMMPPGQISTFTKRRTEVANHPGINEKGERVSLVTAAAELESDPTYSEYEVIGMVENRDGTFSAKLRLKS